VNELIDRIAANVGIDADVAQKAVGMILAFLQSEGPADKVRQMMAAIPGSDELIASASGGGGVLGGLMGGSVMGLGAKLMGLGLGMDEISGVAKETMGYAREHGQGQAVDEIVASIPGLSQFV